jgi:hypothetical protein
MQSGLVHDFPGINWDFTNPGEVSLSVNGYVSNILTKYKVTKRARRRLQICCFGQMISAGGFQGKSKNCSIHV